MNVKIYSIRVSSNKTCITGKLLIEIGDYLIDGIRDKYNIDLAFIEMDEIGTKCIEVAKLMYKV